MICKQLLLLFSIDWLTNSDGVLYNTIWPWTNHAASTEYLQTHYVAQTGLDLDILLTSWMWDFKHVPPRWTHLHIHHPVARLPWCYVPFIPSIFLAQAAVSLSSSISFSLFSWDGKHGCHLALWCINRSLLGSVHRFLMISEEKA